MAKQRQLRQQKDDKGEGGDAAQLTVYRPLDILELPGRAEGTKREEGGARSEKREEEGREREEEGKRREERR